MKKTILAIGLFFPLFVSAIKVSDVVMVNIETIKINNHTYSVKIDNIGKQAELSVTIIIGKPDVTDSTDITNSNNVLSETSTLKVYSVGNNIMIESTPNSKYTIVTINGIVLKSGILDSEGKASIENDFNAGEYVVSIENKESELFSK